MARWGLFATVLLIVVAMAFPAFGDAETKKVQRILQTIPAAGNSNVWRVMQKNKIKLRQGQINVYPVAVPSQQIGAGDTHIELFFDANDPAVQNLNQAATHDLHAKFVRRDGSSTWIAGNGWAEAFLKDQMPWKQKDW